LKTATTLQPMLSTALDTLNPRARDYARASKSTNTLDAYAAAWEDFAEYCRNHRLAPLPADPGTLANYLAFLADGEQRTATIQLKLAAISHRHRINHLPSPTKNEHVKAVMAGIRRKLGKPSEKKKPLSLANLRALVGTLAEDLSGRRDRAVILVGWAGAFRRSELVALDVGDVETSDRLVIRIRKSKTDQTGAGTVKVIPVLADPSLSPSLALRAWLTASGVTEGPLFRAVDQWGHLGARRLSDRSVALIIKSAASAAGLDPALFAGHSLRSGFITQAAGAGVQSRDIMAQTGHKSETVMRGYIQDAGLGASAAVRAAFGAEDDPRKW
jgi:site-specific recombinase XerD